MMVDGLLERDDAEFDLEDDRYVDIYRLRAKCLGVEKSIDVQLDLCIAAAEMCGTEYSAPLDPEEEWDRAWRDLQRELWRIASAEGVGGISAREHPLWERALDIFSARYRSALARWNELTAEEEPTPSEDDMPTTTKRTRKKSPEAGDWSPETGEETIILLRVEKRLKFSGSITIIPEGPWTFQLDVEDAKLKTSRSGRHYAAFSSEQAAIAAAFRELIDWMWNISPQAGRQRTCDIVEQLGQQAEKVLGPAAADYGDWTLATVGRLPETQAEAAAKEAEVDISRGGKTLAGGATAMLHFDEWRRRFWHLVSHVPAAQGDHSQFDDQLLDWFHSGKSVEDAGLLFINPYATDDISPARKPMQPADATSSPLAPPASLDTGLSTLETITVDPSSLQDHPHQPRVSYTGIEELAKSLKEHGQLDDAWGRRLPDGSIELIRGHRRKRAAIEAGIGLRVRIVECSDARALELIGVDDQEFVHFDAIAKARWYRAMLDTLKLSQRDLAARIGVSQADIGNHVRLLDLPAEWQEKVITGEITGTMARVIAPWSERPAVLKAMEEVLDENENQEWTTQEWQSSLEAVLRDLTLPCEAGEYYKGDFGAGKKKTWRHGYCRLTLKEIEEHRDELDIIDVPDRWSKGETQPRAFNIPRWLELNGIAEKRYAEQQAKKASKGKGSQAAKKDKPLTPAQEAEKRKQLAEQLKSRIGKYKLRWLQQAIVSRVGRGLVDFTIQLRLLMFFSVQSDGGKRGREMMDGIRKAGGKPKGGQFHLDEWVSLASLKDEAALKICLQESLQRWLAHDVTEYSKDLTQADVPLIAAALGIDLAEEWRCDEAFLALHTKDQLIRLMRQEWKLGHLMNAEACEKAKRGDVIGAIIAKDRENRLPLPKCLKAKG